MTACISLDSSKTCDEQVIAISRSVVYNELPSVLIQGKPSAAVRQLADYLFERIQQARSYGRGYQSKKRKFWHKLVRAACRAIYANGCIRYSRQNGNNSRLLRRVVRCAVEVGFFHEVRSPPGSPKMSRLIPLWELRRVALQNPPDFDPTSIKQYVQLWSRPKSKQEKKLQLEFDPTHPVAAETQRKLERINATNSRFTITCLPGKSWELGRCRSLIPIHLARFTEKFDWHGRLYTGRYGHQSLGKTDRQTIAFDGEPSVELDYGGMHPRMLYHIEGLEYQDDPYAFWGEETTSDQRLLAKKVTNTALNAKSKDVALKACRDAQRLRTHNGNWKRDKKRDRALSLRKARQQTGLSYGQVYELAIKSHQRIEKHFGSDAGIKLMRHDSAIALDVLYHFATKGVPALGVHDSFIVPQSFGEELLLVMRECYRARLGLYPVVK